MIEQITIDVIDYLFIGFIAIFSAIFMVLFMFLSVKIQHCLDRYRLKYGFDREIERKEQDKPSEERLDKKEQFFKKRVFKD